MKKVLFLLTILSAWAAAVCAQGKYSITSGEAPKAGSTVTSVPFITMTYGAEGDNDFIAAGEGFSEYTPGNGKSPTPTNLPTSGTFYKFDVYKDGTLQVGVVLEANKKFYVLENGVPMKGFNGITVSSLYYGLYSIPVKKNSTYHVYSTNSCLGFIGFLFDYGKNTPLSAYDLNQPLGWGENVTGSDDQNKVTVTTASELKKALESEGKKTIYLKGQIELSSTIRVYDVTDKTIYGIDHATIYNNDYSGCLQLADCNNIIIRNVTFKGEGAFDIDGDDNLFLKNSTNIWIDHCDFIDGVDGNFDCSNGSDNICVSWCRFRYTKPSRIEGMTGDGSGEHRFSNLWGGSDGASENYGKLNTTFVSCWWDQGCVERMPRVRDGKVHVVNCYWNSNVTKYCIGVGSNAKILVENSVFNLTGKATPYAYKTPYDYSFMVKGCIGQEDYQDADPGIDYFTPDYWLPPYSVDDVVAAVTAAKGGAGATLDIEENGLPVPTGISLTTSPSRWGEGSGYWYTLDGRRLSGMPTQKGIYINSGKKIAVK